MQSVKLVTELGMDGTDNRNIVFSRKVNRETPHDKRRMQMDHIEVFIDQLPFRFEIDGR